MREGIIKHSHFKERPAAQEFDPARIPCLEAQIVDLADEIAYLAHDVDDGLKAQMLTVDELNCIALFREAAAAAREASPSAEMRVMRYQTVIRMIDAMATDLVTNIDAELERDENPQRRRRAARGEGARELRSGDRTEGRRAQAGDARATVPSLPGQPDDRRRRAGCSSALFETYMAEPRQMPEHVLRRRSRRRAARARGRRLHRRDDRPLRAGRVSQTVRSR